MPAKKYIICLSTDEREELERVSGSHRRSAREKMRARILLLAHRDEGRQLRAGHTDEQIAAAVGCDPLTVARVRQRAVERGAVPSVVRAQQHTRKARVLDGAGEAHLVALTCSTPPEGEARWSLRLLRERLIELEVVESIGQETIRTTLKKTSSSRG